MVGMISLLLACETKEDKKSVMIEDPISGT
jgi:hypothetical protein